VTLALPVAARADIIDRIVAKVGNQIVTQSDVARTLPLFVQMEAVDRRRLQTPAGRSAVAGEVLGTLVDNQVLAEQAKRLGLSVGEAEVQQHIAEQRTRMRLEEEAFRAALTEQGITLEDFADYVRAQLLRVRLIQSEVLPRIGVSDGEVDAMLNRLYPTGLVETWMTTSHIFVSLPPDAPAPDVAAAEAAIEALEQRLKAGASFESLAAETNVDATARTGGRVGRFDIGSLDPNYEAAAQRLRPTEISGPVRSQFGIHLIRLEAMEQKPFDDLETVRDRARMAVRGEKIEAEEKLYVAELRKKVFVEIRELGRVD
jgi:peptidyl-prolyl cis-trans isomerase SurA